MRACNYDKRTALHLAACEGHSDCVKFLVEKCNISPLVKDRYCIYATITSFRYIVIMFLSNYFNYCISCFTTDGDLLRLKKLNGFNTI